MKQKHFISEKSFNINDYTSENSEVTKYGLPKQVFFCKTCVISNQRPSSTQEFDHTKDSSKATIFFDKHGVCDACKATHQKNNIIDWNEREAELQELCNRHRRSDGGYDCLVPGSGGKDSFFASHILKYKYGMNPLTVTWAPHIYTDWGWRNFQKWIHAGFDNVLSTPNGKVHRLLTRLAVENMFHPFQPFIIGQKLIAPKMAITHKIPLVFYGENEAEYGNPLADNSTAIRDSSYFAMDDNSKVTIGGITIHDLIENFGLSKNELSPYIPPNPNEINENNVEVHYLGYYLKWHPQTCYYYSVENGDFEASPMRTPGTYSKYNSIDDKMDDLHFYTYFTKFGIGRATYDASQEIRSGDITREEGVALVNRFDGEFPKRFISEIFEYLSLAPKTFPKAYQMFDEPIISRDYFQDLSNSFRSPHLWINKNQKWMLRHKVF